MQRWVVTSWVFEIPSQYAFLQSLHLGAPPPTTYISSLQARVLAVVLNTGKVSAEAQRQKEG